MTVIVINSKSIRPTVLRDATVELTPRGLVVRKINSHSIFPWMAFGFIDGAKMKEKGLGIALTFSSLPGQKTEVVILP